MDIDPFYLTLSLGLIIVIVTLLRQASQRYRNNARKQQQRETALRIAQESERKSQELTTFPKAKVIPSKTRAPLSEPFGVPFSGQIQGNAAKWEVEIHQLGRQIIGQIDTKMAALRAITSEANRSANRLEILVEHLEEIARQQIEWQESQKAQPIESAEPTAVPELTEHDEVPKISEVQEEKPSTVIPATKPFPDALPISSMLKELAEDLGGIRKTILQMPTFTEQLEPATILRMPELYEELPVTSTTDAPLNIRNEVEMLANYGLKPKEIARKLSISPEEVNLILQVGERIGTIPVSDPSPINLSPFPPMSEDFDFDNFVEADEAQVTTTAKTVIDTFKTAPAFKVGIVGVGQCGNNIAAAFHRIGYRRVLLLNTAQTDLDSIADEIAKLPIDKQGAGKDPVVGKGRVEAKATQIRNGMLREFGEDFEKIIVCIGLGGGTGSGGGPAVIELAKDIVKSRGGDPAKDVIVITTLPDPNVDGPRQCFNALKAYGQMSNMGVPMTIIDNAQVGSIIRAKLADGWTPINMWIARTFHMFNAYANRPSDHGAFDGNDFNDIVRRGRLLFSAFRVSQLKDKYAIGDVMAANLERSLFAKCNTKTAVAAGCLMVINPRVGNDLKMEDIAPAFQELNNIMQPNSTLHRGIYIPGDWTSQDIEKNPDLFCYVILGGLDHPRPTLNGLFEKARHHDQSFNSVEAFLASESA